MKKNNKDLLELLKKEGGCKTNQQLLELTEALAGEMRARKRKGVYLEETRNRIKMGAERFKDTIPEADYLK